MEEGAFLPTLEEALGPIDNPRYVVIRRSRFFSLSRIDYHAVPKALSANKAEAEAYARLFSRYVGPVKLAYTRNADGRKVLLKARAKAMSTKFLKRSERHTIWS